MTLKSETKSSTLYLEHSLSISLSLNMVVPVQVRILLPALASHAGIAQLAEAAAAQQQTIALDSHSTVARQIESRIPTTVEMPVQFRFPALLCENSAGIA